MIEPGRKVGSPRIVEQLGEGGMGEVFVAFDEKLQREVALKAVHGELLAAALATRERRLGPKHPLVAKTLGALASLASAEHDYAKAEPLAQRALEIRQATLGADDLEVADSFQMLGSVNGALSRFEVAEGFYREALAIREKVLGADHPDVGLAVEGLAVLRSKLGDHAEAETIHLRVVEIARKNWGAEDPKTLQHLDGLATFYYEQGEHAKAEAGFEQEAAAYEQRVAAAPADEAERVSLANRLLSLGEVRRAAGKPRQAKATWQRSLEILEPLAAGSEELETQAAYATVLLCLERIEEARPWVEKVVARGWKHPDFLALARRHGLVAGE